MVVCLIASTPVRSDAYVTPASTHRWESPAGIRFNDVGGIRFNDAGGIRFNDAGGIRFNDAGGEGPTIDLDLLNLFVTLPGTSAVNVILTYHNPPTLEDFVDLRFAGVTGGTILRTLPMVVVSATKDQIMALASLPAIRSIWSDRLVSLVTDQTLGYVGVRQAEADASMRNASGLPFSGLGVTVAFVDTGIDGNHPDLPYETKVVQNVRLHGSAGVPGAFVQYAYTEGLRDTDLVLGHGTFGAGIAAGTGEASSGLYRGVAPGAKLLGLSVGDYYIINVLEGFDYILTNAAQYQVRVVNCSFATTGPFDPDDPVNIATKFLYDAGVSVVFAAGNYGPAPDTLNPYSVAPWVIGVASGDKKGRLSRFSSRGIIHEGLYHPTLTAPGEAVISTSSLSVQGVFGISGVEDGTGGATVPQPYRWAYSIASGTSFSAPHVAGVIALMLEADPLLTPDEIKTILQQTATPMVSRDRSQVGAGYLDAWAALSATMDRARPYGSFIPEFLDQRPFSYLFGPSTPVSGTVPAGGRLVVPLWMGASPLSLQMSVAWGPYPSANDLDISLFDAAGTQLEASTSINAAGIFGLTEGVTAHRPIGQTAYALISFKTPSVSDQTFAGQYQAIYPSFDLYPDLSSLSIADKRAATTALTTFALTGRGNCFCGELNLTRGEAARAVAMAGQIPQTVPAGPSFVDTPASDPWYPYVESVANPASRRGVTMPPRSPGQFAPAENVSRVELAVAAVNALGLGALAESLAGTPSGLTDESSLPPGTRGHAVLALRHGLLTARKTYLGSVFSPAAPVTRTEAARVIAAMVAYGAGTRVDPVPPPTTRSQNSGRRTPVVTEEP